MMAPTTIAKIMMQIAIVNQNRTSIRPRSFEASGGSHGSCGGDGAGRSGGADTRATAAVVLGHAGPGAVGFFWFPDD